jgi:hypothetical protein
MVASWRGLVVVFVYGLKMWLIIVCSLFTQLLTQKSKLSRGS